MRICHCILAGTEACNGCSNYIDDLVHRVQPIDIKNERIRKILEERGYFELTKEQRVQSAENSLAELKRIRDEFESDFTVEE